MDVKISDVINQPENEKIDFTRDLSSKDSFLKKVCAFANSSGGHIIIGIEDQSRKIIGINENEIFDLDEKITNIVVDNFDPVVTFYLKAQNFKEKIVLILEILPGPFTPYYIKSKGKPDGIYVRVGSSNRQASPEKIAELERRRLNISFDSTEIFSSDKNALDFGLIDYYLERRHQINNIPKVDVSDRFLESIKVIKRSGKSYVCTAAGILLFSHSTSNFFPYAMVKCAKFKGNSSLEYIDKKEFNGSIITQVNNVINFFKINEQKMAKIKDIYREESYIVPVIAIREAVINAIVHRDYSLDNSDIKFNIYDDFIEIISPGRLLFGMDIEDIGKGISKTRNPVIARIFKEIGLIEEFGKGIYKINESVKEAGLAHPKYEEISEFFKVTIYKTQDINIKNDNQVIDKVIKSSTLKEEKPIFKKYKKEHINKIIDYLEHEEYITNSKCRGLLKINDEQARYVLNKLVEQRILKSIGEGKSRRYKLMK